MKSYRDEKYDVEGKVCLRIVNTKEGREIKKLNMKHNMHFKSDFLFFMFINVILCCKTTI